MLTPRENSPLPEKKNLPKGGSNPRRCIKQDSESNTLPTSYSGPPERLQNSSLSPTRNNSLTGGPKKKLVTYLLVPILRPLSLTTVSKTFYRQLRLYPLDTMETGPYRCCGALDQFLSNAEIILFFVTSFLWQCTLEQQQQQQQQQQQKAGGGGGGGGGSFVETVPNNKNFNTAYLCFI